ADLGRVHHPRRAAGTGARRCRREHPRGAPLPDLCRLEIVDHAAGRHRLLCRGRGRGHRPVEDEPHRLQARPFGVHHPVHVRLRTGPARPRAAGRGRAVRRDGGGRHLRALGLDDRLAGRRPAAGRARGLARGLPVVDQTRSVDRRAGSCPVRRAAGLCALPLPAAPARDLPETRSPVPVKALSLGIDIGGTFTDIVVFDPGQARVAIWKESTTPDDPARGVVTGIRRVLARDGVAASDIGRAAPATTLFTNALIERKGARTGLVTTAGFRDVLEIGRERKYELYDIFIEMPEPLVPRPLRREVPERIGPDGAVEIPLDVPALLREVDELVAAGITSLAIVFLHAYANPVHERAAAAAIAERHPRLSLSVSSDIAPEIREYPRASTTVANAYVKPLAEVYLDRLERQLREIGIDAPFFLMLSNGGLTHAEEAKRVPVQLLESGPAAGALAGAWFG